MQTKDFFSKIRAIIREEIEYALDKKLSQNQQKKDDVSVIKHGITMYKEQQQPKKSIKTNTQKTEFSSIKDLLAETKRSLQESHDMEDTFSFNADMAEGFGHERKGAAIPHGFSQQEIPTEVMSALTRDYSALMKKIDENKGR